MRIFIPIISAILGRLDGFGGLPDRFLPLKIFNKWPKRGLNYTRYAIGFLIWGITGQWIYAVTYTIAVSIPYGEKSWTARYFGTLRWFMVGCAFGGASLSWANALWCGLLLQGMELCDIDQAWKEFLFYSLGTVR